MKRMLALLALTLGCSSAMANKGIINFEGTVSAGGTCQIDVVTPGGPLLPSIHMGDHKASDFTQVGQIAKTAKFALRVDPTSCAVSAGDVAAVTYSANYGADPSGQLYQLQSGIGYATGMALALLDKSNAPLAPDTESAEYTLDATQPTDLNFLAKLQTTSATVTEGQIASSISFLVDIR
ncbi:fimbrial protein [Pseudomonas promysalinigenes]|uniref:Type 1 fimbrial protein n=1 Tax=Pseudomonas promysalinigenes TaxID=485898 RepID=A0ABY6ATF0_9PSED|nr:fimbrial protein [Pseudomonas promysalinigenes]UXH41394.1 type 1 fimbrial protein [Pseudomonas promysalinigenes]